MARDFDNFPTYDPIIKNDVYLSNIWSDFMATFVESLREYLSQNGTFIPVLSLEERDNIQNPQEGQMIYVSDTNTSGGTRTTELQIWQVVADIGQWTVIV